MVDMGIASPVHSCERVWLGGAKFSLHVDLISSHPEIARR